MEQPEVDLTQLMAQLDADDAAVREQIARDYGEQCADTDGLAVLAVVPEIAQPVPYESAFWLPRIAELEERTRKLQLRAEQAERNLERTIAERDALRAELNQRMAMPARALKFSV